MLPTIEELDALPPGSIVEWPASDKGRNLHAIIKIDDSEEPWRASGLTIALKTRDIRHSGLRIVREGKPS